MLQVANVTSRAVAIVLVGIFTFRSSWPGAGYGALEIGAFAVAVIVLPAEAVIDSSTNVRNRYAFGLPYALGFILVTCSAAYVMPGARSMLALSFIAAVSVGRRMSLAAGSVVVGLGIAGAGSAGLVGIASTWAVAGYPAALLPAGFLLGHNVRAHRVQAEQSADLLAKAIQLREEQAQVAALDERSRIAREIHDVLAHSLGALGLHIELVQAVLIDQNDVAQALELLEQAHRMTADGLIETRRAVHALRGQAPPLLGGLATLSATHQRRYGTMVSFEVSGDPRPLPSDAGLALTRTTQEALVNTAKYAPQRPVEIRLDYAETHTSVVVTSRLGCGDPGGHGPRLATVNGGYGLVGMRERLLLLDGTFSAGRSGGDWVVVAKVPR